MKGALLGIAFIILCGLSVRAVLAEGGVTDKQILFGQVAALQGPAQDLGQGMRRGLLAAFTEVNRHGGIAGRTVELKSLDDGYEPEKTVVATKQIIQEDKIFAMVGGVGTPTSKAALPITTAAKTPFIGPFTGAEFLRSPYNPYVINVRASYFQETEAWVEHLTKDLGISRIAILYQDDAFGLAGLEGVQRAMAKRQMSLVASGIFTRNTTAVKSALLDIAAGKPEAVVMVAPYKPVAAFIRLAHRIKLNAVFVAISFVGSDSLAKELGKEGAGVIVSQVVPSPWDVSLPLVASYQHALDASDSNANPGFVSLEGYLVGRVVAEALRRTDGDPTRRKFLDAFVQKPFDIGGVELHYSTTNNQGSNWVYFTVLQADGSFKEVTRLAPVAAQ